MNTKKNSNYNYICENKTGDMLIYNTLKSSFTKIPTTYLKKFPELKKGDFYAHNNNLLLSQGIVLPKEINEQTLFNAQQLELISNKKELHIVIVVTTKCNFRCIYCFEENFQFSPKNLETKHMDSIIKFIRTNIHNYNSLHVTWFGGEPLLNIKCIEELSQNFIDICSCSHKPYFASIVTNGYLLTKKTFDKLLKLRVNNYQITIDGLSKTHDRLRPLSNEAKTFDTIINNLKAITESNSNFNISIRTNCNIDVLANLKEYIGYMENLLGNDKRFSMYFSPIYDAGGSFSSAISNSLINNDPYDLNIFAYKIFKHKNLFDISWFLSRLQHQLLCAALLKGNYVFTENGKICKCSTHYQSDIICEVGYFDNNKILIEDSREANWLYNLYNRNNNCSNCFFRPICYTNTCPYHFIKHNNYDFCVNSNNGLKKLNDMLNILDESQVFLSL